MQSPVPPFILALLGAGLALSASGAAPVTTAAPAALLRVLYFTKSSGFEHSVVQRVNGQPSYSEKVLTALAPQHGFEFTFSKDGSLFTASYLARFDVLLFYTSGDLCSPGTDGQPPLTGAGLNALFDHVAGGGGFVGLHSTSDTFHTQERGGGNNPRRLPRYRNYGEAADPFVRMLGGEFIRHGPEQVARARVTDPKFPGFAAIGPELRVAEEWYSLKEFAADNHVLLVMQTAGMNGTDYERPPYPLAWTRMHGQGRVAYNALGHRNDVWDSAAYQAMLVGLLEWAGKRAEADVSPNLVQAAPGHATLPAPPPDMKQ